MTDKNQLRRQLRQRRKALPGFRQHIASHTLARRIHRYRKMSQRQRRVAFYLANDGEISLSPLMLDFHRMGIDCYLPVLDRHGNNRLDFAPWHPRMHMTRNRFGIAEPDVPSRCLVQARQLDTLFMPLVGFDLAGNRLGMGGGFYDRTLSDVPMTDYRLHRPLLVAVAHDLQYVPVIPHESWDIRPDVIITPTRCIDNRRQA
jgi:5-formyltetrahydrofolate cyclo-ligase